MARQGAAIRTSASRRFIPSWLEGNGNESKAGMAKVANDLPGRRSFAV
jgi:hypothetical protein